MTTTEFDYEWCPTCDGNGYIEKHRSVFMLPWLGGCRSAIDHELCPTCRGYMKILKKGEEMVGE